MENQKNKLRIWGCGGAGINIANNFDGMTPMENGAEYSVTYVDTSRSNLNAKGITGNCMVIDNVDGSGKVRRENADVIGQSIRKVLLNNDSELLNVIVYSATGGSGSVFGPLLHKELLMRDENVVSLVIGTENSAIEIQNALNTVKSLDSIASRCDRPVVTSYFHQSPGITRSDIDNNVRSYVCALSILISNKNEELDTADIRNFLDYSRVTDEEPVLSHLDIISSVDDVPEGAISSATILDSKSSDTRLPYQVDYQCVGYGKVDEIVVADEGNSGKPQGVYYLVSPGFDSHHSELETKVRKMEERKAARTRSKRIYDSSEVNGDDLVL